MELLVVISSKAWHRDLYYQRIGPLHVLFRIHWSVHSDLPDSEEVSTLYTVSRECAPARHLICQKCFHSEMMDIAANLSGSFPDNGITPNTLESESMYMFYVVSTISRLSKTDKNMGDPCAPSRACAPLSCFG